MFRFLLVTNWSATSWSQFFYILLMVVFVALLAYYSTRLLAKFRAGGRLFGGARRNLEIIESVGVGVQSAVQIVRAGGRFFFIGVTKERVSLLAELSAEDITLIKEGAETGGFSETFSRFLSRGKKGDGPDKPEEPHG